MNNSHHNSKRHIVIIGGGFGGIAAMKMLKKSRANVTIIDKSNHHLFQPLLYQVATAALSPGDIAMPIRAIAGKSSRLRVILGEVEKVCPKEKKLALIDGRTLKYDQLVLAAGSRYNYFGNDTWENIAPGLKSISDALKVREQILLSLEEADQIDDVEGRKPFLTFVVVGAGPTGVEMAGAIAEIAKQTIMDSYSNIDKNEVEIFLVEGTKNILNGYPETLTKKAYEMMNKMGIKVLLNTPVVQIEKGKVLFRDGSIESANIIWAAGVVASSLAKYLDTELDQNGRVKVNSDLSLPGYPDIFVVGDAAHLKDKKGNPLPAVASVAIQQGRFVGELLRKYPRPPKVRPSFNYVDKGAMATIGRSKAIADIGGVRLSGFLAWIIWSFVHIFSLIGFRNKFRVFIEWMWYYVTFSRGVRLITDRANCYRCKPANKTSENLEQSLSKDSRALSVC